MSRLVIWRVAVIVSVAFKLATSLGNWWVIFAPWYLPVAVFLLTKPLVAFIAFLRFIILSLFTDYYAAPNNTSS